MNYIDIFILVLFVVIVFEGYARGFVVSLLSLARIAVGIPVSFLVADKCSNMVYTNYFRETNSQNVLTGIEKSGADTYIQTFKNTINGIPDVFKGTVDFSLLDNASAASTAESIMSNIVDPIAAMITKVIVFIVTLAVFYIVTAILLFVVKKITNSSHAPFRKTNKFLGALLGVVKALILVFAVARIGAFFTENIAAGDNAFLQQLASSRIIEFANKFNPILFI